MARVLRRIDRAPGVFELEVERDGLSYQLGDCTLVIRQDHIDSRPYSFSSHPDEPVLRFLIRELEIPETRPSLSRWLARLTPGSEVGIGTPFGSFRPGHTANEIWFATGTGISPFLAALRGFSRVRPLAFFVGVRSPDDEIHTNETREAGVMWYHSRKASLGNPLERVTAAARNCSVDPSLRFFLCGNQGMISEVRNILVERGVQTKAINEERFYG